VRMGTFVALLRFRELTSIAYDDTSVSVEPEPSKESKWAFRLTKALKIEVGDKLEEFTTVQSMGTLKVPGVPQKEVQQEHIDALQRRHGTSLFRRMDGSHAVLSTRYCTTVSVLHETNVEKWPNDSEADLNYKNAYDYFVSVYRSKSTDVRPRLYDEPPTPLFAEQSFVPYTASQLALPSVERLAAKFDLAELNTPSKLVFSIPVSIEDQFSFESDAIPQLSKDIQRFLDLDRPLPATRQVLGQAQRALEVARVPQTAVVEAFIAAELAIAAVVREKKLAGGVSKTKLNSYDTEVGIGYMINVELIYLLNISSQDDLKTIGDVDRIRKLRNDVVHNGAIPSAEQAHEAILAVRKLLDRFSALGFFV
jgi:hypothetical protein